MRRFVLRRLAQAAVVLLGVSLIVFLLAQLVPGDPVRVALGTRFDPETYRALRERAGFDQPLPVQYLSYIGGALTGDLGVSFRTGQPVSTALADRLPATLALASCGLLVALCIAVPLGVVSAMRSGSWADHVATVVSQVGVSIPDFWMAILLILVLSGTFGLLPLSGYVALTDDSFDCAHHMVMSALTIGLISCQILTRLILSAGVVMRR